MKTLQKFTIQVLCLTVLLAVGKGAFAAEHEELVLPDNTNGQPISFVSCPAIQDTSTVPCWFADHGDTRYFLGIQQDLGPVFNAGIIPVQNFLI